MYRPYMDISFNVPMSSAYLFKIYLKGVSWKPNKLKTLVEIYPKAREGKQKNANDIIGEGAEDKYRNKELSN